MPRLTVAELETRIGEARLAGYQAGIHAGDEAASGRYKYQLEQAKLQQAHAAIKLMEEAGRIMSRAGYMIGKINGDNSR
jgi:hypothetical protein